MEPVDAAIFALNLARERAYPIAEALEAKGAPLLFTTGYDAHDVLPAWQHVPRLDGQVDVATVVRALQATERTRASPLFTFTLAGSPRGHAA